MEALSKILRRVKEGGFIIGLKVGGKGGNGLALIHLLFANNILIFYDSIQEHLEFLSWYFIWFEAIFGLKINLEKNKLILIGGVDDVEVLVATMGCKVGHLPSTYLGLPLGAPLKSSANVGWG